MNHPSRPCKMRCERLVAPGEPLQPAGVELPGPDEQELIIEVDHCGVCHTDLHLQDGFFDLGDGQTLDLSKGLKLPLVPGHEIAGRVIAQGGKVAEDLIGKDVAVYPWIGCGQCRLCQRGDEHICKQPRVIGVSVDGGYATHVRVPNARYLLDLEGMDSAHAGCLMCSGLTAFSAIRKAQKFLGSGPLLLIGLGGVGMMALRFASAMGIDPVLTADISAEARARALEMGAAAAFDSRDQGARKEIMSATGAGVGAVIDFVGAEQSLAFAQRIVARGGGIIVVGLMGGSLTMPLPLLPFNALTIQGSYVGSLSEAREMLDLVKRGAVGAIPVVERPLSEANEALTALREGRVIGRTVLRP